jgi:thioredoxin reductase (NADPH)
MENVIIMGAGPAGCAAALYTARARLEPLVFEGELSPDILPGGQLMTTTEVENYPGFPKGVTGPELVQLCKEQAVRFGARFESKTVSTVCLSGRPFKISSDDGVWDTNSLIVATGANAKYLGLESEERFQNRGVSACATCDGGLPRFRNRPVVVVGGGDTAMEESLFLTRFASRVHIVHRRDKFRASRIMGERVLTHPKVTVEWNSAVDEILGSDTEGVTGVRLRDVKSDKTRELACAGYFSAIGHKPNTDLFVGKLDLTETGYIKVAPRSTVTSVEGVFAAGDVQDWIYRQAVTAAGTGCMAALDCIRWLEARES